MQYKMVEGTLIILRNRHRAASSLRVLVKYEVTLIAVRNRQQAAYTICSFENISTNAI